MQGAPPNSPYASAPICHVSAHVLVTRGSFAAKGLLTHPHVARHRRRHACSRSSHCGGRTRLQVCAGLLILDCEFHFQLCPATSGATSGSIPAAHSTILTAPLARRYASTRACIQDVCTVLRLIADACLCRMNVAHMMLSRGHVALACYAGGHHGRRAERHQIGLVHRSLVCLMRMASGACADVQE